MSEHWQEVPRLITLLYEVTDELGKRFGRKFTPDGHLMGSLGEAMAVYMYDLVLADPSLKTHDATTKDGKTLVQIKFTAGKSGYGIYSKPQHLIALQLRGRSEVVEVFNGPGTSRGSAPAKSHPKTGSIRWPWGGCASLRDASRCIKRCPEFVSCISSGARAGRGGVKAQAFGS